MAIVGGVALLTVIGLFTHRYFILLDSAHTNTGTVMSTNSFILVENAKNQFSTAELQFMAKSYHFVIISKNYAGSGYATTTGLTGYSPAADAVAKNLVAYNSAIQVLPYYNVKFRYLNPNLQYNEPQFNSSWYLRDQKTGQPIPFFGKSHSPTPIGYYLDMSNPDYRKFAENILVSWLRAAPYAGVLLDSADPIGVGSNAAQVNTWDRLIGQDKINAWNQGFSEFLIETQKALGDKLVIYNGFGPSQARVNRNLPSLQYATGGFNESFCLVEGSLKPTTTPPVPQSEETMFQDLSIMQINNTKVLMEQVNYSVGTDDVTKARLGRYCYGAFLLGEQPGYDFFKFAARGYSSNATQLPGGFDGYIQSNPPEVSIDLGFPTAAFIRQNDLGYRSFDHGYIYVNFSPTESHTITLPTAAVVMNGGVATAQYQQGAAYTIPPQDAAFFLSK